MLRVLACVTESHDLRLVLLAAFICVLASVTAFSLLARTLHSRGPVRFAWLTAAAFVTGCGVWATHFVAMLGFRPNMPMGFDVGITLLSIAVAVVITFGGFALAVYRRNLAFVGGAVAGAAISAMHYTGMAALEVPAFIHFDAGYVIASIVISVVLGALSLMVWARREDPLHQYAAALIFVVGIVGCISLR